MSLRTEAVKKAKRKRICTQCLKHPAIKGRVQCQRCIDTNRRKYQASHNELRDKVRGFAKAHNICTRCFGRPTTDGMLQCEICRSQKRMWKDNAKKPKKKPVDKDKKREYQRRWRAKKLYNKVRSLDKIKHAVDKNK